METETEVERLIRECFDPDVLAGRRPFGKRVWLVPALAPRQEGRQPSNERPKLVLIRGGKED